MEYSRVLEGGLDRVLKPQRAQTRLDEPLLGLGFVRRRQNDSLLFPELSERLKQRAYVEIRVAGQARQTMGNEVFREEPAVLGRAEGETELAHAAKSSP